MDALRYRQLADIVLVVLVVLVVVAWVIRWFR